MHIGQRKRKIYKMCLTICNKRLIIYRYMKHGFLLRKIRKTSNSNFVKFQVSKTQEKINEDIHRCVPNRLKFKCVK